MKALSRGYESWAGTGLGTAGEESSEEVALMLAQFEGPYDPGLAGFLKRIGGAFKKIIKAPVKIVAKVAEKAGPLAAFIPGVGPITAAAGVLGGGAKAAAVSLPTTVQQATQQMIAQQAAAAAAGGAVMPNFFQSLFAPLTQTAQAFPQLLQSTLTQAAQVKAAQLQQQALQKLLGFQQKVAQAVLPGAAAGTSVAVSQAAIQRKAQADAQAKTAEAQRLEAQRLAEEREARRKADDRKAVTAQLVSKAAANSVASQIPRLDRPKIPEEPAAVPKAPPTAVSKLPTSLAIGGVALVVVILLVVLAMRKK